MKNCIMKGWSRMKRFTALLVSLLVILSCTAVFAVDAVQGPRTFTEEERAAFLKAKGLTVPEIVPYGFECPMCHVGTFDEALSYGWWYDDGTVRTCPYNWRYTDYRQSREVDHYHTCNYCGYAYMTHSIETRWICNH